MAGGVADHERLDGRYRCWVCFKLGASGSVIAVWNRAPCIFNGLSIRRIIKRIVFGEGSGGRIGRTAVPPAEIRMILTHLVGANNDSHCHGIPVPP